MARLNERQQEAVDCIDGPLLLLAGAGTGKTTVIVERIANLVRHGVDPHAIMAVTFTNKAAREMRERVGKMLGPQAANAMTVSTFHAFCVQVLRRHIDKLGYSRHFTIAAESYQQGLIVEIMNSLGQVGSGYDASLWRHRIGMAKSNAQWPDDVRRASYPRAAEVAECYERYMQRLKLMDLLDFDDLLLLTVRLWEEHPEILLRYRERYQRLMIDEYQDTNLVQLRLMTMLAGGEGNIAVVGDDDQSIYGWRGANIENILHFDKVYPNARIIRLEQNYRSTGVILRAANAVIAHNNERHAKRLWCEHEDGAVIHAVRCEDESEEARFIVRSILENHGAQCQWRDNAVLYRSNKQSRALEDEFRRQRVPYVLVGSSSFYQAKEILDAGAFLQAAANAGNDLAFLRVINVPPRGIGDVAVQRLRAAREATRLPVQVLAAKANELEGMPAESGASLQRLEAVLEKYRQRFDSPGPLYENVKAFFEELDYLNGLGRMYKPKQNALDRRDNVMELLSGIAEYDHRQHFAGTLEGMMDEFSLVDVNDRTGDKLKQQQDAVTLMTVHASKGLEFPVVYIAGMERDLFPHERAVEEGNLPEERRLFYVAVTRARRKLYLTYAQRRREGRVMMPHPPSKFLDELPEDCVEFCRPDQLYARVSNADALALFKSMMKQ